MSRHQARWGAWVLTLCGVLGFAGPASSQSVFNLNLLGQRAASGDVRSIGLGGGMQLTGDSLGVLQSNPAMLANINRVTFSASAWAGTALNKSVDLSDKEGGIKFTSLAVGFTVARRLRLGVAYRARYDVTAGFTTPKTTADGQRYDERLSRTGGVRSFPFTAAASLGRVARLGGYVSIENGTIEERWDVNFESFASIDAFSFQSRVFSGTGYGVGAEFSLPGGVYVGGAWDAAVTYDTDVKVGATNSTANGSFTESTTMPERFAGSVRWEIRGGRSIHAGATYSDFTKFSGLAFPSNRLASQWSSAIGYEQPGFLGSMPLRLGVSLAQLPYTLPVGESVGRLGLTAGTTWIPPGRSARVDIALEFARVGSTATNGFETRSFRIYVGLGGSETWKHERGDF